MPRRLLVAGVLVLVLAAGLLLWSPWSGERETGATVRTPATGAPSPPSAVPRETSARTSTPSVDDARAGKAVCEVSPAEVNGLAPADLATRVTAVGAAAEGRPEVVPLLTQAEELLRLRRSAAPESEIGTQLSRLKQTFEAVPAALRRC